MKISTFLKVPRFSFSLTNNFKELFSREYYLDNYKKSLEKTGLNPIILGNSS